MRNGPTDLPSWYNARLHTPAIRAVQRTIQVGSIENSAFDEVYKAVNLNSSCFITIEKILLPSRVDFKMSNEGMLLGREVRVLSSISHVCFVIY